MDPGGGRISHSFDCDELHKPLVGARGLRVSSDAVLALRSSDPRDASVGQPAERMAENGALTVLAAQFAAALPTRFPALWVASTVLAASRPTPRIVFPQEERARRTQQAAAIFVVSNIA